MPERSTNTMPVSAARWESAFGPHTGGCEVPEQAKAVR